MTGDPVRVLVFRLTAVAVAILLAMAAFACWNAFGRFDPVFTPELGRKATTVGRSLAVQVERGLEVGIPLERLVGVSALFAEQMRGHPEIAYVLLTDGRGTVLAEAGGRLHKGDRLRAAALDVPAEALLPGFLNTAVPLQERGETVGRLHVGVDAAYLAKASVDLMLDIVAVLVVSVLLTFEVLLLVVNLTTGPMSALRRLAELAQAGDLRAVPRRGGGRAIAEVSAICREALDSVNARYHALVAEVAERHRRGEAPAATTAAETALERLASRYRFRPAEQMRTPAGPVNLVFLRLPVFLFCMSEELSRPFLPSYAQTFAPTVPWLTPDLVVSAPITLFMLIWALSQPGGARWSERWGRQRSFVLGAVLGAVGLVLTAFAGTLYELLFWRSVTALGYGLVLITAQGIVIDHTDKGNRASGMATFIGALLAAGVCGPVSGGIIADQAGFRATFLLGAVLAVGSGIAISLLLRGAQKPDRPASAPTVTLRAALGLARNTRFMVLMLLSAIPTKIAATGVLFCLIPMLLAAAGSSKAEVGRVQMMYFVVFILVSPLAATLSDRWGTRRGFVALGGLGTLASCLPLVYSADWWAAPLAIGLFGLSQALVGAPQLTLVSQVARDAGLSETSALGWYRLLERLGGAAGPLLAMGLAFSSGYLDAMIGISLLCGGSAVLFWLTFRSDPEPQLPAPQEA